MSDLYFENDIASFREPNAEPLSFHYSARADAMSNENNRLSYNSGIQP